MSFADPSDVAQFVERVLPDFPRAVVEDLRVLLTHHLDVPTAATARWAQLGLLVRLIDDYERCPTRPEYETARERAAHKGQHYPSPAALSDDYGSWRKACQAAVRFATEGTASRVPRSHKHTGPSESYTPRQALNALCRVRDLHDQWPTEWEYGEWAQLDRDIKRRRGEPPRTPGLQQLRDLFGDYATALLEAQALHARLTG